MVTWEYKKNLPRVSGDSFAEKVTCELVFEEYIGLQQWKPEI